MAAGYETPSLVRERLVIGVGTVMRRAEREVQAHSGDRLKVGHSGRWLPEPPTAGMESSPAKSLRIVPNGSLGLYAKVRRCLPNLQ